MSETATEKLYSIATAAAAIGKSTSQIKAYKKLVLEAFKKDTSKVQSVSGSLTEYGLTQLKLAAKFYANSNHEGYKKAVFQANPSLEYCLASDQVEGNPKPEQKTVYSSGAMVPVRQTNQPTQIVTFDKSAAAGDIGAIQRQGIAAAHQLGDVFSAYAQTRVRQAFHEIDATVEAYKANALIDMGLASSEVTERP
jgi:hypothetical protein